MLSTASGFSDKAKAMLGMTFSIEFGRNIFSFPVNSSQCITLCTRGTWHKSCLTSAMLESLGVQTCFAIERTSGPEYGKTPDPNQERRMSTKASSMTRIVCFDSANGYARPKIDLPRCLLDEGVLDILAGILPERDRERDREAPSSVALSQGSWSVLLVRYRLPPSA